MTRRLGQTDIEIAPLVFGGNVLGWTADEPTSFTLLDAFVAEGFTAIDTADVYSRWAPGNDSESERIIGRWLKARGNRDRVHIFTKVGSDVGQGKKDLSAKWIEHAIEASLQRLQTDYIDLYQSHWPDPTVSQEETLAAYDRLIKAGKVRFIGASNYDAALLSEALTTSKEKGLPRYQTLQNEYNLHKRDAFEGEVQDLVLREGLGVISYYALAAGFLTGKYRTEADLKGARGESVRRYLNERGLRILAALDTVAERTGAAHSEIAVAWVIAQPGITAPISSATSLAQLASLIRGARLTLAREDIELLTDAGR
ncbi:aryl-alcohol dehydrogenase-like predicted oxidoreductase [Pseudochelatococcus lubricantis]|uniref:Aryl-alcohol dehydrogenase-like predicted oxidoreductase n=1 Tax=Pseudochelatococcus lubricantis TaxID=1538102 RepID=A0ABX0V0A0_9HYPH|nr:aldo/keto reductase [Pseudochelatococcus lubricantis]NIJ57974.1 aryl-alcohol dehydrogenase-like predicted oxidoreductase [Pseudochelatococcus lubricantis]